jgi:hypothetical protein
MRINEPVPPEDEVVKPSNLKHTASELWDEYAPSLIAMKTLTAVDVPTMTRWCMWQAKFLDDNGKVSPAFGSEIRQLEAILGIGAASRARLGTKKGTKKDPADEFFKKA